MNYCYSDAILFLQSLSHAHFLPQDHAPILQRLFIVLENDAKLFPLYSNNLSSYLRKNIELGIKIMETLDCFVFSQSLMTKEDRLRVSMLLDDRYKLCESWDELKKLESINSQLVASYLWVFSKVSEWRRVECQEREFRQMGVSYLNHQLQEFYTMSRYSFEQTNELVGMSPEQPLLGIYRATAENNHLFLQFVQQQNCLTKLYSSLFYLSAYCLRPYSRIDFKTEAVMLLNNEEGRLGFRGLKVVIFVAGEILTWIERISPGKQRLILCGRYGLVLTGAKISTEKKMNLVENVKAAATALIASLRSLDNQFRWVWFTKIVMDLLDLCPNQQRSHIQEIQLRAKHFANFLQLVQQ